MRLILLVFIMLPTFSFAATENLVCWDKRSSRKAPVLKAVIESASQLSNIIMYGEKVAELVDGKENPDAIKYKDHLYFSFTTEESGVEVILPVGFLGMDEYFGGVIREKQSDGGNTTFLNCRIN